MTSFKDLDDIQKIAYNQLKEILKDELDINVTEFQFNITTEDVPGTLADRSYRFFTQKRTVELVIDDGLFQHIITGEEAEKYYRKSLELLNKYANIFRSPLPILFRSLL